MAGVAFFPTGNLVKERVLSEQERTLMNELFQLADENKDGVIDYDEYARMFAKRGLKISPKEVKAIFDMVDKNKDSKIQKCEVFDCEAVIKEKAKAAMRAYDTNRDGKVSMKEMKTISGDRLSAEQIRKVFAAHDANGDGFLDHREMEKMMAKREKH